MRLRKVVVLTATGANTWGRALHGALSVLADMSTSPKTAPDYEPKRTIRQEQRRLTAAESEVLCREYQDGTSTYQLAKKWDINRHTVTAILKRNGIEQRDHTRRLSDGELAEAQALHAEGWSVNALAQRYAMSPKTMKNRLTTLSDD